MKKAKFLLILFALNAAFAQEENAIEIFEPNYALKNEQAKEAVANLAVNDGGGSSWRGWARATAFAAAAVCGTVAVMKYSDTQNHKGEYNGINKTKPATNQNGEYNVWYHENYAALKESADNFKDNRSGKNIFGIGAGVFAIAGTLTFFF